MYVLNDLGQIWHKRKNYRKIEAPQNISGPDLATTDKNSAFISGLAKIWARSEESDLSACQSMPDEIHFWPR